METVLCDGKLNEMKKCKNNATYIARSDLDPISCVYYCCKEHKGSYEDQGFIVENYFLTSL